MANVGTPRTGAVAGKGRLARTVLTSRTESVRKVTQKYNRDEESS